MWRNNSTGHVSVTYLFDPSFKDLNIHSFMGGMGKQMLQMPAGLWWWSGEKG